VSDSDSIEIDDTALDLLQPSVGVSVAPTPDRAVFTRNARGFRDTDGNWLVRETISGEVFPASLNGRTLVKSGPARSSDESDLREQVAALTRQVETLTTAMSLVLGRDLRGIGLV